MSRISARIRRSSWSNVASTGAVGVPCLDVPSVKTISREIMHAKLLHAADTCQSLACVIDSTHQRLCNSCHFSVAIL